MDARRRNYDELRVLFWETTTVGAPQAVARPPDNGKSLDRPELTTEEALQFIRNLANFAKPIFVLTGGEPLARPDIFHLAKFARQCGLTVCLSTSGALVDERIAHMIHESGVRRVAINIDGADDATHDGFHRQPGLLAATLRGFRNLKRLGLGMQINCTVTKHNLHQLEGIYALALELGASALHLFLQTPLGPGSKVGPSSALSAEEYERVLHWIYDKSRLSQIQVKPTCAPQFFRVLRQRAAAEQLPVEPPHRHGLSAMTQGCLAGREICCVSASGEVYPCVYLRLSVGNVSRENFRDIWEDSTVFARLRNIHMLQGKCRFCEFKRVCRGCRARAYYATGNYLAQETHCHYMPQRLREPQPPSPGVDVPQPNAQ